MADKLIASIEKNAREEMLRPRALDIARAGELSERDHLLTLANIAEGRS